MRDDREADSPATRTARLSRRSLLRRGLTGLALTGSGVATAPASAKSADPAVRRAASFAQTQPSPQFTQQQKLAASDGDSGDSFGQSVAVSADGTTALIAAFEDEDPNGDRAGSAYVFNRSAGRWSQQQKLAADDGDIDDGFGVSVSLSDDGTTALIGAADVDERDDDDETGPGSAYVFTESGGNWSQQQKLTATDRDTADVFGEAVSLSDDGTTALIGASGNESAYIFTESGGTWSQQQKLSATDGDGGGIFGNSVSLSNDGTTALIGDFGSAFIFTKSEGRWDQQQKLTPADGTRANFGSVTIANDGTTVLIGALSSANSNGDRAGSAFVFTRNDQSWSQRQKLIATDGDSGDNLGRSVSLSADGTTAVIGADADENSNGDRAGATYVFSRSDGSWSQQQKLSASDGGSNNFFGRSVSVSDDGTTALIGAAFASANGSSAGSAYVFTSERVRAPGDGAGPSVRATVQQAGTPRGQARVQYTVSNISGQASVGLEFTTPSELSVNASASETTGTFGSNAQRVLFFRPDSEVTATVAFEIPARASADATFDIEATVLDENSTATDTVTTTVGDVETGPVARFDADDDGEIELQEVQTAIRAFSNGELDLQGVQQVIGAFSG